MDSFRGELAAEKSLIRARIDARELCPEKTGIAALRPIDQRDQRVSIRKSSTVRGSISGRLSGKVGQMNAPKPKIVPLTKKTSAPKPERTSGASQMREAANEIVARDCKPIVEALSSNSQKGQMQSARFLYSLAQTAEASGEGGGGAEMFRSIALEWANSPEWKGETEAETADEEDDAD